MSFITTKFHEILTSGFSGVALTNCSEKYLSFWSNFLVQKGALLPEKTIECKFPVDMHICTYCLSILQSFHKIMLSGFRGVALTV